MKTMREVPATDGCTGCYYYAGKKSTCGGIARSCKWWTRPDGKSIIYKKVTP